jgi:UDP-N-acetylglucosamine--N-acetylmuramyl-(pentapeptide) pyrophosphoryl-undecaprenol N-acetylglucosamine transferase
MTNYLLAGGGTGGHVNPLLALAERIRAVEPESKVIVLGTLEGLESRLVPERGFELVTVERLPFPRKPSLYALRFPVRFKRAVSQVQQLLKLHSIDVVVGFGGYASAPAYVAASRAKVPYVVHEANALSGLANRLGARKAAAVGVAFPGSKFSKSTLTGMPLRAEIERAMNDSNKSEARAYFGLDERTTTLLITGGSLGANRLNQAVVDASAALNAAGIQVIHIVGDRSELPALSTKSLARLKYCDRMDLAMAAADLAVSRAGASTVSEFAAFGLPAVYVPYPIGNGEQKHNVEHLLGAGAARLVADEDFTASFIRDQVIPLISSTKELQQMKTALKQVGIADGTQRLLQLVHGVLPSQNADGK